jgi:hypothetical protein
VTKTQDVYYVSGPMRGKPNLNKALFAEVTAELAEVVEGKILNPADNFGGDVDRPTTEYLNADLKQVLDATVIVQLPGWQESEGAVREAKLGVWTGKRFSKAEQCIGSGWVFIEIEAPEFSESVRGAVLDEAKDLITGDRNSTYGPPDQDFRRSAGAATAMGYRGPDGRDLLAHDIAILVELIKISRLMWTPTKRDSWVDTAGYAGCGLECALLEEQRGEI